MLSRNSGCRYYAAPYLRLGFLRNELHLGFGSIQKIISNEQEQLEISRLLKIWEKPKTQEEVLAEYFSKFSCDVSKSSSWETLTNGNFIIPFDSYDNDSRFSRPHLYYLLNGADSSEVQKKLSSKHVVVLGCGGIGNLVSVNLATAGVGQMTLVDGDSIELSNLTRQILFEEGSVGKFKVDVLKESLEKRASFCQVKTVKRRVGQKEEFETILPENADLIIVSADYTKLMPWINEWSVKNKVPYVNVGYVNDVAVWGPFVIPGKTSCWQCHQMIANEKANEEITEVIKIMNSRSQAPSNGPVNMLSSSLASLDCLRYLASFGEIQSINHRIGLWSHNLVFEKQYYPKNKNCCACGA